MLPTKFHKDDTTKRFFQAKKKFSKLSKHFLLYIDIILYYNTQYNFLSNFWLIFFFCDTQKIFFTIKILILCTKYLNFSINRLAELCSKRCCNTQINKKKNTHF